MDHETFLAHIRTESARFREALARTDPHARVPHCPAWNAADLLVHLTNVQDFWAHVLTIRPEEPTREHDGDDAREHGAQEHDARLAAFDAAHESLMRAFEGVPAEEAAWTWSADPAHHTVAFIGRRQAHEALIHRVDAEQAAGMTVSTLDPALAADGVDEVLDVMYGGCPPWGEFNPLPHHLRLDLTDTGESIWVQTGRFGGVDPKDEMVYDTDDIHVVADPGVPPDAVIAGEAATMLLRLWRRGDGAAIRLTGDLEIVDVFRSATHGPLN